MSNKTLKEQLEAKNHQSSLVYLWDKLTSSKLSIDEELILKLHSILMNSILSDAGIYRRHGVRIVGANVPTANFLKIPVLMDQLCKDIETKSADIITQIAIIHSRFEQIHPFPDGNGRIGRLIMVAMALQANLAPPIISQESKQFYYACLNKAQLQGDTSLFEDLICDYILDGYELIEG